MRKTTDTGKTFLSYFKANILSHKIQKAAIAVMAAGVMALTGCESGDMPALEIPGGAPSLSDSISAAIHVRATYAAKAGETVRLYKPTINIEKMFIGGKEVKPQAEYTFHEAGEYTVSYSLEGGDRTENIFLFCTALKEVTFSKGVKAISPYTCYGCSSLESVKLPSSVTEIGRWAFAGCASLTSIEIPKGVSAIPEYIFFDCSSLKTVEIPESIAEIGIYAFYNCTALDSVKLPAAVKNIGRCAFMGCKSLTSIVIPKGVGKIEKQTFAYCTSLAAITCKAMAAPTLSNYVFSNVKDGGVLTVPTGATGYEAWMEQLGARWKKEEYSQTPSFTGEEQGKNKNSRTRTIKFRGKAEDGGEWFYGYLQIYQETHASKLCVCAASVRTWKDALLYAVDPVTVGQFTGLLDKNGKEIYEGDIICGCNPEIRHLIFYSENHARFMAALVGDEEGVGVCGLDKEGWRTSKEVIGNIYDNPDLLHEEEIIP